MRQDFGPSAKIDFRPNTKQHSNGQWNYYGKSINDPYRTFFWNHYYANLPENSVRDCLDQGIVVCRQVPPSFPIADSTGAGGKAKEFPERLTAIPELCPTDQVDLEIFQLEKNPLCILQGRAFSTEL